MLENKKLKNIAEEKKLTWTLCLPPGRTKFVLKFTIKVSFHIFIKQWVCTIMNNENNTIHMSIKYMTMYRINLFGNGTHPLTKFRLGTHPMGYN